MELRAGPDLRLQSLGPGDAAELFRLTDASRGRLRRWLPWVDAVQVPEDSAAFIRSAAEQAEAGTGLHLAIRERGALVGVIGCLRLNPPQNHDIGYWLGEGCEGRGLMTAACRALVGHLFAVGVAHRVQIRAALGNASSRAVPERLGFRLEGVLREAELLPQGFVDHCLYGLVVGEWTRRRGLRPPAPGQASAPPSQAAEPTGPSDDDPALDAEMAEYCEARAPEYDDWYERRGHFAEPAGDAAWFAELAQLGAVVRRFAAGLPPGAAALDVGCGTGRWTAALAESGLLAVVGLDRAPAMLAEAQATLARLGLRALLIRGDALELPFPAASFDAAVSGFVFDHLAASQRAAFLAELRRVLRSGGRVLILDSRREPRHSAAVEIQTRLLRDGRRLRVRKSLFTPEDLGAALLPLGPAAAGGSETFFVWAEVRLP